MVTRRVAMETLIQAAKDKGTQYIFLSPLPLLECYDQEADIKIQSMEDPIRISDELEWT